MNYTINYAELDNVTLLDLLAAETSKLTRLMVSERAADAIQRHKAAIKAISAELEKRKKADPILLSMLPQLNLPDSGQPNH